MGSNIPQFLLLLSAVVITLTVHGVLQRLIGPKADWLPAGSMLTIVLFAGTNGKDALLILAVTTFAHFLSVLAWQRIRQVS